MLLFDSSCLPVSDWRLEVCRYTWTWRNRLLGTLPYVQESNLILIHFRFNSCWRLNSVGTDQINYPIHLLAAAGKPPNSGLWIIGRHSPSIRVSGTVHKCRLLRWPMRCEERGVWMSFSVCPVSLPISENRSKPSKKRIPLSCIHGARWSFEPSGRQHGKFSGFTSHYTLWAGNKWRPAHQWFLTFFLKHGENKWCVVKNFAVTFYHPLLCTRVFNTHVGVAGFSTFKTYVSDFGF